MHSLSFKVGALITLTIGAAHAEAPRAGLRATVTGQGLTAWSQPEVASEVLLLNDQLITLPLVEAMIPVGSVDLLLGFTYARTSRTRVSKDVVGFDDFGNSEYNSSGYSASAYNLGLTLGLAAPVIHANASTVRVGGRLGTAFLSRTIESSGTTDFDGTNNSATQELSLEGFVLLIDGFVAGEHMFSKHVGLQVEAGLNLINHANDEDSRAWLGLYSALSGVIRF